APEPAYRSEEALRRYAQARLSEEQGSGAEALREYYRAMLLDDQSSGIPRRVSEVTAVVGDPAQSLEFAERALAIDPSDPRALWLKGSALLNLGRDGESLDALEAAAHGDTDQVEYARTLARAAERLDRAPRQGPGGPPATHLGAWPRRPPPRGVRGSAGPGARAP